MECYPKLAGDSKIGITLTGLRRATKRFNWRVIVYRLFGVLNFLVVVIGVLFEPSSTTAVRAGVLANTSDAPYFLASFWTMFALNFCFSAC